MLVHESLSVLFNCDLTKDNQVSESSSATNPWDRPPLLLWRLYPSRSALLPVEGGRQTGGNR